MSDKIKLKISLPAKFKQACADMNADPRQVLQQFVDDLCFLAQVVTPGNDPKSYAGMVLRKYFETFASKPIPDYQTKETNVQYVQKILDMLRTKMTAAERQAAYSQIIDRWYEALRSLKNSKS